MLTRHVYTWKGIFPTRKNQGRSSHRGDRTAKALPQPRLAKFWKEDTAQIDHCRTSLRHKSSEVAVSSRSDQGKSHASSTGIGTQIVSAVSHQRLSKEMTVFVAHEFWNSSKNMQCLLCRPRENCFPCLTDKTATPTSRHTPASLVIIGVQSSDAPPSQAHLNLHILRNFRDPITTQNPRVFRVLVRSTGDGLLAMSRLAGRRMWVFMSLVAASASRFLLPDSYATVACTCFAHCASQHGPHSLSSKNGCLFGHLPWWRARCPSPTPSATHYTHTRLRKERRKRRAPHRTSGCFHACAQALRLQSISASSRSSTRRRVRGVPASVTLRRPGPPPRYIL